MTANNLTNKQCAQQWYYGRTSSQEETINKPLKELLKLEQTDTPGRLLHRLTDGLRLFNGFINALGSEKKHP